MSLLGVSTATASLRQGAILGKAQRRALESVGKFSVTRHEGWNIQSSEIPLDRLPGCVLKHYFNHDFNVLESLF